MRCCLFDKGARVIERKNIIFVTILVILHLCCGRIWARPTKPHEARKVVEGWLKADSRPLGAGLGRQATAVETFTDDAGEPIYYAVYLQPSGFVIVSADDSVEPIIAFADEGIYDPSPDNPLGALVSQDLRGRVTAARAPNQLKTRPQKPTGANHQHKWNRFTDLADTAANTPAAMGTTSVSDIRVAPLVQSKWSQRYVCNNNPCYNYYTPSNYYCGCVATAMAQLMRYHQHPSAAVGQKPFLIRKDSGPEYWVYTLGGDGYGGAYRWSDMVLTPNCSTTQTQRQAIGALCYDAAISINTNFCSTYAEADTLDAKDALTETFQYGNAVKGCNYYNGEWRNIGSGLVGMINPNLDAKDPVILGIKGSSAHAVLCDGYGYNATTLYHHLNMGWGGTYDAWYNLPTVDPDPNYTYTSVYKCVYNIHITGAGNGEVISGRVFDFTGRPIPNPTVYAQPGGIYAESDDNGIYAFDSLNSNTTYTISVMVDGYIPLSRNIKTGKSNDMSPTSGNVWGVDFYVNPVLAGDLNHNGEVDMADFAVFTSAWLSEPGDANWNPYCDISTPHDSFIDAMDLAVFVNEWLAGKQ